MALFLQVGDERLVLERRDRTLIRAARARSGGWCREVALRVWMSQKMIRPTRSWDVSTFTPRADRSPSLIPVKTTLLYCSTCQWPRDALVA